MRRVTHAPGLVRQLCTRSKSLFDKVVDSDKNLDFALTRTSILLDSFSTTVGVVVEIDPNFDVPLLEASRCARRAHWANFERISPPKSSVVAIAGLEKTHARPVA